jgi:hypothetical protein
MLTVSDLQGLWGRSLIVWPDGRRDEATYVSWLQGPTYYIDLRSPSPRPGFIGTTCLDDLSREQIIWLATQEGFAGRLRFDGEFFEWQRIIDFQPKAIYSDCGRLWIEAGMMIEEGRDIPYIEHWRRHAQVTPQPCWATRLRDRQSGCDGFVVRVGSAFMYARGRTFAPPAGHTLSECVAGAGSLREARVLVDCEVSIGRVDESGWIVERSSLPFREGSRLGLEISANGAKASSTDVTASGVSCMRDWDVIESEGDIALVNAEAATMP